MALGLRGLSGLRPLGLPGLGTSLRPSPELSEEEERGWLRQGMGLLSYLGESLDKPHAALRGSIVGEPGSWKHAVPFSETLSEQFPSLAPHIKPPERVYGRDVLEHFGAVGPNRPGFVAPGGQWYNPADWDWGDVAGLGVEFVDPMFLLQGPLAPISATAKAAKLAKLAKVAKVTGKAADVGTDFGQAVSKLRKLAAKPPAAKLAETRLAVQHNVPAMIAEQFRAGERPLLSLRVPFTKPSLPILYGGRVAASAVEKAFYGRVSPLPLVRGMFSHTAGGAYTAKSSLAADLAFAEKEVFIGALQDSLPAIVTAEKELMQQFGDIAKHHNAAGDRLAFNNFSRMLVETNEAIPDPDGILTALRKHVDLPPNTPMEKLGPDAMAIGQKYHEFLDGLWGLEDRLHTRFMEMGGDSSILDDLYAKTHFGRTRADIQFTRPHAKIRGEHFDVSKKRKDPIRNVPGATAQVNVLTIDPLLTGTKGMSAEELGKALSDNLAELPDMMLSQVELDALKVYRNSTSATGVKKLAGEYTLKKHLFPGLDEAWPDKTAVRKLADGTEATYASELRRFTEPHIAEAKGGRAATTELKAALGDTDELVKYLANLPSGVREQGGMFSKNMGEDFIDYMSGLLDDLSTLQTRDHFLAGKGLIKPAAELRDGTSLWSAWEDAGFNAKGLATFIKEHYPAEQIGDDIGKFVSSLAVDDKTARALKLYNEVLQPQVIGPVLKTFDEITATYRSWLTIPWAAFHTRNLGSGYWQAWSDGRVGPLELAKGMGSAARHMATSGKKPMKHFDTIRDLKIVEHGWVEEIAGEAAERAAERMGVPSGPLAGVFAPTETLQRLRGLKGKTLKETAGKIGELIDPLALPGGFRGPGKANILMERGGRAYKGVEWVLRAGYAEALFNKGFKPSEVVYLVKRAHFDYSDLSKFEKGLMRRGVFFFGWLRNNIPYQLMKLAERPYGPTGTTIRAITALQRDRHGYVPSWLRERMGIRVGGDDRAARYVVQGGIAVEDLNKIVMEGGLPSKRTLAKLGSQIHAFARFPLEAYAGKQLYSGRELKDLQPVPIPGLSERQEAALTPWIMASPASRAITEVRKILRPLETYRDPTKDWWDRTTATMTSLSNSLTGFKIGTWDAERLRLNDLQKAYEREAAANPWVKTFEKLYVPARFKEKLNKKDRETLRRIVAVQRKRRELSKKRAQELGAQ